MVPMPTALSVAALVGRVSLTEKVSLASFNVSPLTGTAIVMLVLPAANVSVPVLAVKSAAVAVPTAVAYLTVIGEVEADDRVTVNVALTVPLLPSLTATSLIDRDGTPPAVRPSNVHEPFSPVVMR